MIKNSLVILLSLVSLIVSSQELEFGVVSKEELMEKEYANDPSAPAAILYKHHNTYYLGTALTTEIHERIKIYSKEGFDYATEYINLFKGRQDDESVSKIKAVTYNLVDGKITEDKLEKDQIFKTEASYNYNRVSFTMPNVQVGSVIEFKYKITSPFIWNIDEFRFQYDIPVKQMLAEIRTPKGFVFNQTPKGYLRVFPTRSVKKDNRVGMDVVINKYFLNNVPAMKEEKYVDNIDNYRSGIMFELVSIDLPGYYKSFAKSWSDVAKTIGNSEDYKNKLDRTNSFDDELDALLSDHSDQMSKMKAIFKYVKDNVKWNGMDGKYFYHGLKKALKEKTGNAADMNLLLVAMLRYAGLDANPVIISTKENTIPLFPTVDRLNYVLAYAKVDDKPYFLDATEEFSDINLLPIKDYNWRGILIDNNDMVWTQIDIATPPKSNRMYSLKMILNEDGTCEGTYNSRLDKHSAMSFRKNIKDADMESYLTELENRFNGIEISDHTLNGEKSYDGFVKESFSFYDEEDAELIDDELYVNPLSFLRMEENPFRLEERQYPIDFGFPFKDTYMLNIKIPDGFSVTSKPEPILMKLPDDLGLFKYAIKEQGQNLSVLINFEINSAMVPVTSYPILKEFYKQIISKEAEKVILSKV
ncbi:DUF3857 domain-containing protein [Allomuricauda sp. SCSIO 65647]|uniref:DUF3857 domain-containing protein n=1 Tax=Allomuricauda sp. SCSIO 65647 TaxID=2908843 RepID=UPI001F480AB6|nr:DUF3857 domain-containing protein [Muricauda sp. SCSIO 65647]UJH68230.1 DUF3857 and transglutaminase domain-containing protein [Muricauda sp. SCSIO 65647]